MTRKEAETAWLRLTCSIGRALEAPSIRRSSKVSDRTQEGFELARPSAQIPRSAVSLQAVILNLAITNAANDDIAVRQKIPR